MPSLEEFHTIAGVNKLLVQDIEDQSLIYPTGTKWLCKFILSRGLARVHKTIALSRQVVL
jgi:hypothetical protein